MELGHFLYQEAKMSKRFVRNLLIGTRISANEKRLLQGICKAEQINMSDLLRRMIFAYLEAR